MAKQRKLYLVSLIEYPVQACPCCGGTNLRVGAIMAWSYGVRCNTCKLTMDESIPTVWTSQDRTRYGSFSVHTLKTAIDRWNQRKTTITTPPVLITFTDED